MHNNNAGDHTPSPTLLLPPSIYFSKKVEKAARKTFSGRKGKNNTRKCVENTPPSKKITPTTPSVERKRAKRGMEEKED